MRGMIACVLLSVCLPCAAADDFKILRLEQEVLDLERRVDALSRQVADLQQRAAIAPVPGTPAGAAAPAGPPAAQADARWLSAANWNRVRPGMSEFEVIDILGPPTTLRGTPDSESRTLMYAMEIGSSGFLSGSVQMKDHRVVDIQRPVLK